MKMNWGTGILIGIIIFIVIVFTMTVIFMSQDVHLVTDNYYEKTLKYQDEIDKQSRTMALDEEVAIKFDGKLVNILFPADYMKKNVSGEIYFYRPSNPALDIKVPLQLSENGSQVIPVKRLEKGYWRLKINWMMGDNSYYNEKPIIIQ